MPQIVLLLAHLFFACINCASERNDSIAHWLVISPFPPCTQHLQTQMYHQQRCISIMHPALDRLHSCPSNADKSHFPHMPHFLFRASSWFFCQLFFHLALRSASVSRTDFSIQLEIISSNIECAGRVNPCKVSGISPLVAETNPVQCSFMEDTLNSVGNFTNISIHLSEELRKTQIRHGIHIMANPI